MAGTRKPYGSHVVLWNRILHSISNGKCLIHWSFRYQSVSGLIYFGGSFSSREMYGPKFGVGDTIGLLWNRTYGTISYTKNGEGRRSACTLDDFHLYMPEEVKVALLPVCTPPKQLLRLLHIMRFAMHNVSFAESISSKRQAKALLVRCITFAGRFLGIAFRDVKQDDMLAAVQAAGACCLQFNFGATPFKASMDALIMEQERCHYNAATAQPAMFIQDMQPLHIVCAVERKPAQGELLALLLAKGATVDARDTNHWSPLHYASLNGWEEGVKVGRGHRGLIIIPGSFAS